MRDLLLVAVVAGLLPLAAVRPFLGLLLYSWLSYMRPQDLAWGFARELPLSQAAALAILCGLVLNFRREHVAAITTQTVLLFLLMLWIALSTATAVLPELAVDFPNYWKAISIAILTTGLVRDRARLRMLWAVIAGSLGLLGAKYGLYGILKGGARFDQGPGGFFTDNNSFAVGLCMVIPMLVALAQTEASRWVRAACYTGVALSVATVIFTFSRGGLLTLGVVAIGLAARSRHRLLALLLVAVVAVGVLAASTELRQRYLQRAATIADYEDDESAQGRLASWQTCWRVFLDHPVLGVGPDNLVAVYWRYNPRGDRFRVAHNAYLEMLSESGLPALLLFLAAFGVSLWRLERLRRGGDPWFATLAGMLEVSLLAYLAGSVFLNLAYLELAYHLIGVAVCLEVASRLEVERPAPAEAAGAVGWWSAPAIGPTAAGAS
jgi:probable O-glycosylation ligase (exosortase A-associated)